MWKNQYKRLRLDGKRQIEALMQNYWFGFINLLISCTAELGRNIDGIAVSSE